jgi:hypothetical protein
MFDHNGLSRPASSPAELVGDGPLVSGNFPTAVHPRQFSGGVQPSPDSTPEQIRTAQLRYNVEVLFQNASNLEFGLNEARKKLSHVKSLLDNPPDQTTLVQKARWAAEKAGLERSVAKTEAAYANVSAQLEQARAEQQDDELLHVFRQERADAAAAKERAEFHAWKERRGF